MAPGTGAPPISALRAYTEVLILFALAFLVGGITTSQLAGSHHYQQPAHLSVPYLMYSVGGSLFSGVVEEMAALAFVVSTLRQARRPAAEVIVVAVLLRCSYHIYYGAGIAGIAIWATVFTLLYLRFRSVIPLIILHFLWDSFQFLALKWSAFFGLGILLGLGCVITALIMWIVAVVNHRDAKRLQPGGFAPYPGATYPVPQYPGTPYPLFALGLAADQFITARDLRSALGDLGEPAVSEHPFSGPRPDTERFAVRAEIASPAG